MSPSSAPGRPPSTPPAPLLASEDPRVEVDMIERLPTPWGLVRLGVAPDHPQLKTVSRAFEKIAARPGFRFLGNVEVGRDVTHDELASLYDAVVYAVGSQTDRRLGIPGEDLPGSWAATELVAWYNGHPDFQHLEFDLSHERAVVIGNGNVALDVARMLALTREELAPTDTTDAAIDAIVSSGIREIVVLGRRGPVQAAWTSTELGELGELAGADVVVDPAELELDPVSEAELEAALERRPAQRRDPARVRVARAGGQATCRAAPVPRLARRDPRRGARRGRGDRPQPPRAGRSRIGSCGRDRRARGDPVRDRLSQRRLPRRRRARACRSTSEPARSRTTRGASSTRTERPIPGLYCAGWIKRGPTGVIGTNKKDATETVERLLEDARAGRLPAARRTDASRSCSPSAASSAVMYSGWEAIDALERSRGERAGPPAHQALHAGTSCSTAARSA